MNKNNSLIRNYKIISPYPIAWAVPNIVMINSDGKIAGRIHPNNLTKDVIEILLTGGIPDVENGLEDAFDPVKAEEYFRSYLKKQEVKGEG